MGGALASEVSAGDVSVGVRPSARPAWVGCGTTGATTAAPLGWSSDLRMGGALAAAGATFNAPALAATQAQVVRACRRVPA